MNDDERKRATQVLVQWLTEERGEETASFWAWERTPMPFGLPSDEQLDEGLRLAVWRAGDPPVCAS